MGDIDYDHSLDMEKLELSNNSLNQLLWKLNDISLANLTRPNLTNLKNLCRKIIESYEPGQIDLSVALELDEDDPRQHRLVEDWMLVESCFLASATLLGLPREGERRELVFKCI